MWFNCGIGGIHGQGKWKYGIKNRTGVSGRGLSHSAATGSDQRGQAKRQNQ